ncbi:MAG: tetratricopeptide repeat protein [Chitinophagales bacterium]|nr:tetratricopeptide repeat protein [Chitinophagales bacterium]
MNRTPALLLAMLAIVLYAPTIAYDFALDDYSVILENGQTRAGIQALPEIFRSSYRAGYSIQSDELYRPLPKAVFALSWEFFGENPMPLHLLNVLVYAACGVLLWVVLMRFTPLGANGGWPAFVAAALYVAHPVHSEVVANIKSLDELLALLLLLASLTWFLAALAQNRKNLLAWSVGAFFLALISKESSLTFWAVYPLAAYVLLHWNLKRAMAQALWFAAPAFLMLIIRSQVVTAGGLPHPGDNLLAGTDDRILRLTTAVAFLGKYLKLLFVPYPLSFDYSYAHLTLTGFEQPAFWFSLSILTVLFAAGLYLTARRHLAGFGILFFFITISVSSNLFVIIGTHFGERLLFLPSVGFAVTLGVVFQLLLSSKDASFNLQVFRQQPGFAFLLLGMLTVYSLLTWNRIGVWKNNLTLFESGVRDAPRSFRTHYYLGQFLVKEKAKKYFPESEWAEVSQRGLQELRAAIGIMPQFTDAWLHIGNYFFVSQNWDSAEFYYRKCIALDPQVATAYNNLATVMQQKGNLEQALYLYDQALQRNPTYADALRNKGSVLGMMGRYREALPYFERAIQVAPGEAEGYLFLGITYRNLGQPDRAKPYLDQAVRLNPALAEELQ